MNEESPVDRLSRISTQWTLVFRGLGGPEGAEPSALEELMNRYHRVAYQYLMGALQDANAAEDLFQQFALRFVRGDFKRADPERGRFRDYLKTALIRLVIDHRRQQKNQAERLDTARLENVGPNGMIVPTSWSADGRFIAFTEIHRETRGDIWVLHLDDEPRAEALILTSNDEREADFSPRGDQIAFVSNEDGRSEVYIRSFPETGPRTRVSTEGGRQPLWSADGSTLYYRSGDRMMAVAVEDGDPGSPAQLFEERLDEGYINHPRIYDVIPDGQGFYAAKSEANSEAYRIDIVLNFFDVLERLVPTRR